MVQIRNALIVRGVREPTSHVSAPLTSSHMLVESAETYCKAGGNSYSNCYPTLLQRFHLSLQKQAELTIRKSPSSTKPGIIGSKGWQGQLFSIRCNIEYSL